MSRLNKLDVFYHNRLVGTMALYQNRLAAFEYNADWLMEGFSISPLALPLEKKVFMPKIDPFEGLFGVFADSLPDGWGRLLVDRLMRKNGLNPQMIGSLERLALVGSSGIGLHITGMTISGTLLICTGNQKRDGCFRLLMILLTAAPLEANMLRL